MRGTSQQYMCSQVLQLYQITSLHHGLMMVGPSGSGKSSAWRVLLKALERLEGVEGVAHVIDPKVKIIIVRTECWKSDWCLGHIGINPLSVTVLKLAHSARSWQVTLALKSVSLCGKTVSTWELVSLYVASGNCLFLFPVHFQRSPVWKPGPQHSWMDRWSLHTHSEKVSGFYHVLDTSVNLACSTWPPWLLAFSIYKSVQLYCQVLV